LEGKGREGSKDGRKEGRKEGREIEGGVIGENNYG